jgi:hypothetical protein
LQPFLWQDASPSALSGAGPLINRAINVVFEGVPTHPTPARCWEVVEKYQVGSRSPLPSCCAGSANAKHLHAFLLTSAVNLTWAAEACACALEALGVCSRAPHVQPPTLLTPPLPPI